MDKYKRYNGVIIFVAAVVVLTIIAFLAIRPMIIGYTELNSELESVTQTLEDNKTKQANIQKKLAKLKESIMSSQKKIYSPIEDIGSDSLFFTLYSDLIEMVHSNSIKIDSIEYQYNPENDEFVKQKDKYFVCDVNLKLVSNYVNLGKLVQDLYQYPYYIRINDMEIYPYPKDKKILLTKMSVRLYAHTAPESEQNRELEDAISGAETPIPQE